MVTAAETVPTDSRKITSDIHHIWGCNYPTDPWNYPQYTIRLLVWCLRCISGGNFEKFLRVRMICGIEWDCMFFCGRAIYLCCFNVYIPICHIMAFRAVKKQKPGAYRSQFLPCRINIYKYGVVCCSVYLALGKSLNILVVWEEMTV